MRRVGQATEWVGGSAVVAAVLLAAAGGRADLTDLVPPPSNLRAHTEPGDWGGWQDIVIDWDWDTSNYDKAPDGW